MRRLSAILFLLFFWIACSPSRPPASPIERAREAAESGDAEAVGRWYLAELVLPGGTAAGRGDAARANVKDRRAATGALAAAIDAEVHGRFGEAAAAFVETLVLAAKRAEPDAPLIGWYAATHLRRLRANVADVYTKHGAAIEGLVARPGNLGFRARSELADLALTEALIRGPAGGGMEIEKARELGCVTAGRFAGPFGQLRRSDLLRKFAAESATPWPVIFAPVTPGTEPPRVYPAARRGCRLVAEDAVVSGFYYFEAVVELPAASDVVVVAAGTTSVLVDDVEILSRSPERWGALARFGIGVGLEAGRHRIVAKLDRPEAAVRLFDATGRPLRFAEAPPSSPYEAAPPRLLADPNPLDPFLTQLGVARTPPAPAPEHALDANDPILRFVAGDVALVDGHADIASVLVEPLVRDALRATPVALQAAANAASQDPYWAESVARSRTQAMHERASKNDPALWLSRLWLATAAIERRGPGEVLGDLEKLAVAFPEVAEIAKGKALLLGRLGYKVEHERAVRDALARFPDDADLLAAEIPLAEARGETARVAELEKRLARRNPDAEIPLKRAIARKSWDEALRLAKESPFKALFPGRVEELLVRAGWREPTEADLADAIRHAPKEPSMYLGLADAKYARGDRGALRAGLADVLRAGIDAAPLRAAIEVVDGRTGFEAFRFDAKRVIHDYEAANAGKTTSPGGAAVRVLDYAALWIRPDGSARMLEHEILKMTSREAITEHAEQKLTRATILRMRTIKQDGSTYEPEIVPNKPTATMPHLDVGDYVETESIYEIEGDGAGGKAFLSPRWYFREAKVDYFRSEFVVISPKAQALVIETTGDVPSPPVVEEGAYAIRRFRVDKSPALPEEPLSAPIEEFLPSVRLGWGITEDIVLSRLAQTADLVRYPADPRMVEIALKVATGERDLAAARRQLPNTSRDERARRIYRYVAQEISPGREGDPRKTITGKSGDPAGAFVHLAEIAGLEVAHGMVKSRLSPPARGSIERAERFGEHVIVVGNGKEPLARSIDKASFVITFDKFVPYGFLPSSLRGQEVVLLTSGLPRGVVGSKHVEDLVETTGEGELARDGSLVLSLTQTFFGRRAVELRSAASSIPTEQLKTAIESRLLPQLIPGARLQSVDLENQDDLDAPVKLVMKLEVSSFARQSGNQLIVTPPFTPGLSSLATLASRETPLFLSEARSTQHKVAIRIALPKGASVSAAELKPASGTDRDRAYAVRDRVEGGALVIERSVDLPAGRVAATEYAAFQAFVRALDEAFERDIAITLE